MAKKKKFNDYEEMDCGYTYDGEYEDDWGDKRSSRKKATKSDKYRDSRNRKRQYDFGTDVLDDDE